MNRRQPYQYLKKDVSRHGTVRWYVRRVVDGVEIKTRLPDYPGASKEAEAAYYAALANEPVQRDIGEGRFPQGSFGHLVGRYLSSGKFLGLAPITQQGYRRQLDALRRGDFGPIANTPYKAFKPRHIAAIIERKAKTPGEANNLLKALQAVFTWAVRGAKVLDRSPVEGFQKFDIPEGRKRAAEPWTDYHAGLFRRRWPLGTPQRTAFEIMWHTGLRIGDAVRLGPQHIKAGRIRMQTHKRGVEKNQKIELELARALAAGNTGQMTFLATQGGRPRSAKAAYTWFSAAAREAGLPDRYTSHGCRKGLLTALAEKGGTDQELAAVAAHSSPRSLKPYVEKASRARLSDEAFAKLRADDTSNKHDTGLAHPIGKVSQSDA